MSWEKEEREKARRREREKEKERARESESERERARARERERERDTDRQRDREPEERERENEASHQRASRPHLRASTRQAAKRGKPANKLHDCHLDSIHATTCASAGAGADACACAGVAASLGGSMRMRFKLGWLREIEAGKLAKQVVDVR